MKLFEALRAKCDVLFQNPMLKFSEEYLPPSGSPKSNKAWQKMATVYIEDAVLKVLKAKKNTDPGIFWSVQPHASVPTPNNDDDHLPKLLTCLKELPLNHYTNIVKDSTEENETPEQRAERLRRYM